MWMRRKNHLIICKIKKYAMKVTRMQEICDSLLEMSKKFQHQKKSITAMLKSFARSHLEYQSTAQCLEAIN